MEPVIRRAVGDDCKKILKLLSEVEAIHQKGRPDIFRVNGTKFTEDELVRMFADDATPIFVADVDGEVMGYAFCVLGEIKDSTMLLDAKTLHIEDVCVDENTRGTGIGGMILEYVLDFAKKTGIDRVDLDVWEFNNTARAFYEKHGFKVQKRRMDIVL